MHFPMMTVNDTLHFAAKTRAPQNRLDGKSRVSYVEQITEVIQTIFGLRHVKKTPVGDASLRGVSGGEKKRVSIGEALALRSLIGSWDKYVVLFFALYFEFTSSCRLRRTSRSRKRSASAMTPPLYDEDMKYAVP